MPLKITFRTLFMIMLCSGLSVTAFSQGCPTHQALLDKMDEIFESGAVDRLGEVYHTNAVTHSPEGSLEGLDKIKEAMQQFYTQVPDPKGVNHDVFCSGDKMAVRWTGSGTMNGKKINVNGITIYHIRDGKVAESWEEMNMMDMMMQMGYELKPPSGGR